MSTPVTMKIGDNEFTYETQGKTLVMTASLADGKSFVLTLDDSKAIMGKLQQLTGRAAWELSGLMQELLNRLIAHALKSGNLTMAITAATVEETLRKIFPDAIPAEAKK